MFGVHLLFDCLPWRAVGRWRFIIGVVGILFIRIIVDLFPLGCNQMIAIFVIFWIHLGFFLLGCNQMIAIFMIFWTHLGSFANAFRRAIRGEEEAGL